MIPLNSVYPFLYIMDIVKDFVQFVLLLVTVGGLSLVLKNWSSFSSTVSKYIFFDTLELFFIRLDVYDVKVVFFQKNCYLLKVF